MGNTRGNSYSRNHVTFEPCSTCPDFWNFGFDDEFKTSVAMYVYKVYGYTILLHLTYKEMWISQFIIKDIYFYIKAMTICILNERL